MDILVLFLSLEEMLSVFHHWSWCLLWLCHLLILLCWGRSSLFPRSGGYFYHKWVLNFVKRFSVYWDYHIFLIFNLLMWCITLVDLCVLKNPCIPGIRSDQIRSVWDISHLIMAYDPFNVFWIQFASILLRIFVSCSAMILVYNFLFCDIFVWFWY